MSKVVHVPAGDVGLSVRLTDDLVVYRAGWTAPDGQQVDVNVAIPVRSMEFLRINDLERELMQKLADRAFKATV